MSSTFVRVRVTIEAERVEQRIVTARYQKKVRMVAPDRASIPELLQESTFDAVADKVMDALEEINVEHASQAPDPTDG